MPPEILFQILVLLFAGLVAGFLAGLFGVGGGIVIVPALYALFRWMEVSANSAISIAVGTSLVTLLPTACSSLRAHYKLGNVNKSILLWIAPSILIGAIIASSLVVAQFGRLLLFVFSGVLLLVACITIVRTYRITPVVERNTITAELTLKGVLNKVMASIAGFLIGLSSSLAGVGGGATGVPVLLGLGLRTHAAIGTASSFGVLVALPSIIALLLFSYSPADAPWGCWKQVYIPGLVVLSFCTVLVAPYGARLGKKISEKRLKVLFASLLFVVGARLLVSSFMFPV